MVTYLSKLNPSVNFIAFGHKEKWRNECIRLIKEKINIDNVNIQLTHDEHPFKKIDLIFVDGK